MFNLKQILSREDVQKGILTNLFISEEEVKAAISYVLTAIESEKDNEIIVACTRSGAAVEFENTLYVDEIKKCYLLESRLFYKDGNMINAYLEIFNSDGTLLKEYIDDVWQFADWVKI